MSMSEEDASGPVGQHQSNNNGQPSSTPNPTEQQQKLNDNNSEDNNNSRFECNICLDVAKDAVVSLCGHLFCWPCLYQWLDTRPNHQICPVCKSTINKDRVIPLYGRGGTDTDPREKVPPRPQGQRIDENAQQSFPGMFQWGGENGHGGLQFSLGIGVFPISFFASFFNTGMGGAADRRPEPPPQGTRQQVEEQFLSNMFMYIGLLILLWLILF